MLDKVKLAMRIKTSAYDSEILLLIEAAKKDLYIAGVTGLTESELDPLIERAIITYCMMNFGEPAEYDRLKKSYDEQKSQMSNATGYTEWNNV